MTARAARKNKAKRKAVELSKTVSEFQTLYDRCETIREKAALCDALHQKLKMIEDMK